MAGKASLLDKAPRRTLLALACLIVRAALRP